MFHWSARKELKHRYQNHSNRCLTFQHKTSDPNIPECQRNMRVNPDCFGLFEECHGKRWQGMDPYSIFSFYVHWVHITQLCIFSFIQIVANSRWRKFCVFFQSNFPLTLKFSWQALTVLLDWEGRTKAIKLRSQVELSPLVTAAAARSRRFKGASLQCFMSIKLILKCVKGHWNVLSGPDDSNQHVLWFWIEESCLCQSTRTC